MPTQPKRKTINLSVFQGEARRVRMKFYDTDKALIDVSSWGFECLVRDASDAVIGTFSTDVVTEDADGGPITHVSTGIVDLVFNETWTGATDAAYDKWDVLVTPDDRRPFFPFGGVIQIKQPVTRP